MKIDATIKEHTVGLSCVEYGLNVERAITRPSLFKNWISAYRVIVQKADPKPGLLTLGQSMYDYLDGEGGELTQIIERCDGPLVLELIGNPGSQPKAQQFLEAPWELLANHRGFLAASLRAPLLPLRCVSNPELTLRSVAEALPLVFMAAQTDADILLRYEQEEAAILRAVADTPLDVIVEESGSLRHLFDRISQIEGEYLLHLSMHGRFDSAGRPALVMETEVGGTDYISAVELAERLSGRHPRFLFLSACHSAASRAATDSLVLALTRCGFPAVLGWSGTVEDGEATEFTSILYERIASGDSIENAVLAARQTLLHKDLMSAFPSRNWHLARLYFGPNGRGVLMTSNVKSRLPKTGPLTEIDRASSESGGAKRMNEFVGYRRELQKVLKVFSEETSRSVVIHGLGGQGKTSLAAKVATRLPKHRIITVESPFNALKLLTIVQNHLPHGQLALKQVEEWSELVKSPDLIAETLLRWLTGPFAQAPVLIILDGFERMLGPQTLGLHQVKPEAVHIVKALVHAFARAKTPSRLLFTSRVMFSLEDSVENLSQYLVPVHLGSSGQQEGFKRAAARAYARDIQPLPRDLIGECVAAGCGNPELESILFTIAYEDPAILKEAIDSIRAYAEKGVEGITHHAIKTFLEKVDIKGLVSDLTLNERELLRVVSIFDVPLPTSTFARLQFYIQVLSVMWLPLDTDAILILEALAERMPQLDISLRLFSSGLLENCQDVVNQKLIATQVHPLVNPAVKRMGYEEFALLAHYIADDLFSKWTIEDVTPRPPLASMALLSIGLTANRPQIVTATATDVLVDLFNNQVYKMGDQFGARTIKMLDNHGARVPLSLLTMAGRHAYVIGDYAKAASYYDRAVQLLREEGFGKYEKHFAAYLLLAYALVHKLHSFNLVEATTLFEEAVEVFLSVKTEGRPQKECTSAADDQNLTEDDIADRTLVALTKAYQTIGMPQALADTVRDRALILETRRPELSLSLYQQALELYEELGDLEAQSLVLGRVKNILISMAIDEKADHPRQRFIEAAETLIKLIRVCRAQNDSSNTAIGLFTLIKIYMEMGEMEKALETIPETCELFSKIETPLISYQSNSGVVILLDGMLAQEQIKQGYSGESRERVERLIAWLNEQGDKEGADEVHRQLSQYPGE